MPITLDTEFCERKQNTEEKIQLAKWLNTLLGRAQYFKETSDDESDQEAEEATLGVVNQLNCIYELKLAKGRTPSAPKFSGRKLVL